MFEIPNSTKGIFKGFDFTKSVGGAGFRNATPSGKRGVPGNWSVQGKGDISGRKRGGFRRRLQLVWGKLGERVKHRIDPANAARRFEVATRVSKERPWKVATVPT